MIERIEIGPVPCNEKCASVGDEDYYERAQIECKVYRNQLYRFLESNGHPKNSLPEGFSLTIKGSSHDFGTYYEVACKFNDECGNSWNLFTLIENFGPLDWDDEAKKELESSKKENS